MTGHALLGGLTHGTIARSHVETKEYKRVMWNVFTWSQKIPVRNAGMQRDLKRLVVVQIYQDAPKLSLLTRDNKIWKLAQKMF